jgi:hypothetical protein
MPRDGAIICADLIGKLDVLYLHCPKCSRAGRYSVKRDYGIVVFAITTSAIALIGLLLSPHDSPLKW